MSRDWRIIDLYIVFHSEFVRTQWICRICWFIFIFIIVLLWTVFLVFSLQFNNIVLHFLKVVIIFLGQFLVILHACSSFFNYTFFKLHTFHFQPITSTHYTTILATTCANLCFRRFCLTYLKRCLCLCHMQITLRVINI